MERKYYVRFALLVTLLPLALTDDTEWAPQEAQSADPALVTGSAAHGPDASRELAREPKHHY